MCRVQARPPRLRTQRIELPEEKGGKVRAKAVAMAWLDSGIDHICTAASDPASKVSKHDEGNPMRSQSSQFSFVLLKSGTSVYFEMFAAVCAIEYWPQHGPGMAITQDDERSESGVIIAASIFKAVSMVWNSYILPAVIC